MIEKTMQGIVTIDVGTSSLRSSLYTMEGVCLHSCQFHYGPEFMGSNRVEQDPGSWEAALLDTLHGISLYCSEHRYTVEAMSIASQRASVIPLDAEGKPLYRAIMWQDKRSITESELFAKTISPSAVYRKTGLRIDSYFSAPKIMWLKYHEPEMFDSAQKFIGVQDYVAYLLTGSIVTDASQASRTLMMNLATRQWDPELLAVVGIPSSKLPQIIEPSSVCGRLTESFASRVGLASGIPVILAGGDQGCAAMSLGMVEPGVVVANTGTGSFTLGYAEQPQFHALEKTLCSAGTIPGSYFIEAGLITSGILMQWFVEQFLKELPKEEAFSTAFKEILTSSVGSNGVVLMPHFKGVAAPFWNPLAKGMFFNVTLSTTRGDMARSVLEGISLDMALNFALVKETMGGNVAKVAIAGGMTRRGVFNQMQADVYNQPVWIADSAEASSLGAWMSGAVAIGVYENHEKAFEQIQAKNPVKYEPNSDAVAIYAKTQQKRLALYDALVSSRVYETFAER